MGKSSTNVVRCCLKMHKKIKGIVAGKGFVTLQKFRAPSYEE